LLSINEQKSGFLEDTHGSVFASQKTRRPHRAQSASPKGQSLPLGRETTLRSKLAPKGNLCRNVVPQTGVEPVRRFRSTGF
jgi:hypothetical protein